MSKDTNLTLAEALEHIAARVNLGDEQLHRDVQEAIRAHAPRITLKAAPKAADDDKAA